MLYAFESIVASYLAYTLSKGPCNVTNLHLFACVR